MKITKTKLTLADAKIHFEIAENSTGLIYKTGKKAGQQAGYPLPNKYFHVYGRTHHNEYAHRIVWMLKNNSEIPEGLQIDHIDRNRQNNHPSNLRVVTPSQNAMNRSNTKTK